MRFTPILPVLVTGILVSAATGQTLQAAGFYFNSNSSASIVNHSPLLITRLLTRIDDREYRDWGVNSDIPNKHDIRGISLLIQDANGSTPEVFSLLGYGEVVGTHLPDPADNFLSTAPIPVAPSTPGPVAYLYNIVFVTPAIADVGEDVFLGIEQPPVIGASDGVGVHSIMGEVVSGYPIRDLPGANVIAPASYTVGWVVPGAPVGSTRRIQLKVDPLLDEVSGHATAVTNQTSFPTSNNPPGTASFFSGLHPDAKSPPHNPGRADNVGFRMEKAELAGVPVVFFIDTDFWPATTGFFLPGIGSRGTFCLKNEVLTYMGVTVGSSPSPQYPFGGVAEFNTTIPAGTRPSLAGVAIVWWGVGIKEIGTGFQFFGSPCAKQRF